MDVLVLDSDASFGATIDAALGDVNVSVFRSLPHLRSRYDALVFDQRPFLVCNNENELRRCMEWNSRLLAIFWARELPASDDILRLMRIGVRDLWLASEPASDWVTRLQLMQQPNENGAAISADLQRDIQMARSIQQNMWPQDGVILSDYRFSLRMLPAGMLSGDFVDYFAVGSRHLIFFMADVAGHGISPALLTVALKNISWRLQQRYGRPRFRTPGQMLEWINGRIMEQSVDLHVAMFLAVIDLQTHNLHYASAAHFPPSLRVSDAGEVTSLEQRGKPLGLFADASYESAEAQLSAGDSVVVFSDGVLEQYQASDLATREQALKNQAASADDIEGLWSYVTANVSGEDDVSLLVVERLN